MTGDTASSSEDGVPMVDEGWFWCRLTLVLDEPRAIGEASQRAFAVGEMHLRSSLEERRSCAEKGGGEG